MRVCSYYNYGSVNLFVGDVLFNCFVRLFGGIPTFGVGFFIGGGTEIKGALVFKSIFYIEFYSLFYYLFFNKSLFYNNWFSILGSYLISFILLFKF